MARKIEQENIEDLVQETQELIEEQESIEESVQRSILQELQGTANEEELEEICEEVEENLEEMTEESLREELMCSADSAESQEDVEEFQTEELQIDTEQVDAEQVENEQAEDDQMNAAQEVREQFEAEQMLLGSEEESFVASEDSDSLMDQSEELEDEEEEETQEKEFIEAEHAQSIIESIFFASDRPVSLNTLKLVFKGTNIRLDKIRRAIDALSMEYASGSRGVCLEEVNGGYQLRTKMDNLKYLKRMIKGRTFRLSGPALETLSIVAYKQPVVKLQIDEIRGVESGHLLRALMEKGLVRFDGKSDLPGKPMLYATTKKFLEIFGLRSTNELPTLSEIDELLPEGIGEETQEEKITLSQITDQMSEQLGMSYSQGEEQLAKISEELAEISSTTEFFEQEKIRMREERNALKARDLREALAVGETVDEKDLKWLARYEAAQRGEIVEGELEGQGESVTVKSEGQDELEEALAAFDAEEKSVADEEDEIRSELDAI